MRRDLDGATWQSTITVTFALLVGVLVGTALGRWIWRVLARVIGVVDTPVLPALGILAVVALALAAGAVVATAPGVRTGRLPAVVPREGGREVLSNCALTGSGRPT